MSGECWNIGAEKQACMKGSRNMSAATASLRVMESQTICT